MVAGKLKDYLEKQLSDDGKESAQIFFDQQEAYLNLNKLLEIVQASESLVVLLTKEILHRPYCLLEIYVALLPKFLLLRY